MIVVSLLGSCALEQPPARNFLGSLSESDEIRLGRDFRREAKKTLKLINHPEIYRYVENIGQRILSAMGPQSFDYRFFIVEDPQLNAFAVPGGSIYLHTGLIEKVRSTDELASVMGHEIVHVKSRHIARMSGPDPMSLLGLVGIFLAGGGSGTQAIGVLGQALSVTKQLSYNRELEQEADTLGVKYMSKAGYDPRAALDFLDIINQESRLNPVDIPAYLLTHPLTQDRIGSVEAAIRSFNLKQPHSRGWDPIRKIQVLLSLQKDEPDAGTSRYERLIQQTPKKSERAHLLGIVDQYKGRWSQAREHYERARSLDSNSPGIDRDLGRVYTQAGEFRLAHGAFERALASEPREPLTYLYLGELFEKEAALPDAVSAYLRAHNLSPLWFEPARRLGIVYGKLNRPGDSHYYLGRSHLLLDEDDKAIIALKRALEIAGPTTPRGQVIKDEIDAIKEMQ